MQGRYVPSGKRIGNEGGKLMFLGVTTVGGFFFFASASIIISVLHKSLYILTIHH